MSRAAAGITLTPRQTIEVKSDLLYKIRTLLRGQGFAEVTTPTFRQADDLTGKRARATVGGRDGWLRSMIGPALRYQLAHTPRVFEIGACFRNDPADHTHLPEFSMLDLYAAESSYDYLIELAENLVRLAHPGAARRISVAEHLGTTVGVDLARETLDRHTGALAAYLDLSADTPLHDLLDAYIAAELEPRSAGMALFLVDMPLGGNEPCAKLREDTAAVLNRFEVFIDGVEVVHGYEDETDAEAFIRRASAIGLYNPEQSLVQKAILAGAVPSRSVGLGIGIERLCMAATGVRDIRLFRQSATF
ncbi:MULTISPECIES: amino acid--tRNA ligase-related protein [Nocardia]|uniref:amino acid--tRNA ligase-related protein n=1 Tax=Nocardia TaxID=1817 RepID=UPI00030FD4FD|nr:MULTISPECIES: amino acid--tRNA ligase-related protein [Nocardia]